MSEKVENWAHSLHRVTPYLFSVSVWPIIKSRLTTRVMKASISLWNRFEVSCKLLKAKQNGNDDIYGINFKIKRIIITTKLMTKFTINVK